MKKKRVITEKNFDYLCPIGCKEACFYLLPKNSIIFTMDVSSLYTNIPNQEGITSVADHLRADLKKIHIMTYILDLMK